MNLLLAHTMYLPETTTVASAILATTQRVRNTTTLIITPTFRSASTIRLWG